MSAEPAPRSGRALLAKASLAVLLLLALLLSALLWPAWTHNPDLSHGIFMPVIFLLLIHRSRTEGPGRFLSVRAAVAGTILLSLAGLGLLILAGLYAAVLDWSHALVEFLLAGSLAGFLGAGLFAVADRRLALLPFNWASVAAAALWPLCAPIPPGTYSRLTSLLQLWVSTRVVDSLHLLGIAAFRAGNIIELAHTRVGVEEACSGVRSLVSCVFAGLFFSAALVSRPAARAFIIGLAPVLALAMNFLRSLFLTLLADQGIVIEGFWHDATGIAVLGLTAAILGGAALLCGGNRRTPDSPPGTPAPSAADRTHPGGPALPFLAIVLGLAAVLLVLFRANTRPNPDRERPVPDLLAALPAAEAGWQVITTGDLYRFRDVLQTDLLAQRTYRRGSGPDGTEITVYLAYWRPGQASVSLVASHTPDACWPGAGWTPQAMPAPLSGPRWPGGAEGRFFANQGYGQYVWFWHLVDGHPIPYRDPYSFRRLLEIAWQYGFRHNGDQLFLRISSNRPWSDIAGEPVLSDIFARLRPLGL